MFGDLPSEAWSLLVPLIPTVFLENDRPEQPGKRIPHERMVFFACMPKEPFAAFLGSTSASTNTARNCQHRKQLTVSVRDESGNVTLRRQVSTEWKKVQPFFHSVRERPRGLSGRHGNLWRHGLVVQTASGTRLPRDDHRPARRAVLSQDRSARRQRFTRNPVDQSFFRVPRSRC